MATPAPRPPARGAAVRATIRRHRLDARLLAIASAVVLLGSIVHESAPALAAPAPSAPLATAAALVAVVLGPATGQPGLRADPSERRSGSADALAVAPTPLGPPARAVYRVKTRQKLVALTFDDGWSPAAGHLIVDTLLREHVAATFFVNARYIHWDPALWKQIGASGFVVGNHTYDHRDLTTMSAKAIAADIDKNARVFNQLTGYTMAPIFRPPYGAHDARVDAAILAAGYATEILWDVVAGDTSATRSDRAQIASATRGGPGSILLLHMGPSSTPRILAAIIGSYRARGFRFVTVPQLLAAGS